MNLPEIGGFINKPIRLLTFCVTHINNKQYIFLEHKRENESLFCYIASCAGAAEMQTSRFDDANATSRRV